MFDPILTKADAEKACRDAGMAFLFLGALQAILAYFLGFSMLFDAAFNLLFGAAVWRWKSRIAAVLLVLLSSISLVVTLLNILGVTASGGRNIILSVIIVGVAIRAIQATFKYRQFGVDPAAAPQGQASQRAAAN